MAKRPSQPNLKPNASAEDKAAAFAEYSEKMGEMARIKQAISVSLGRYEKLGVDPKAVKFAYRMSGKEDAAEQHRKNTEYLALFGIIEVDESGQANFVKALQIERPTGEAATKLAIARAYSDGYNSGRHGGKIDACRFKAGSEEFVSWRNGWEDGAADRLAKNPEADKVKVATGRRGGRKAGAKPGAHATADGIGAPAGTA